MYVDKELNTFANDKFNGKLKRHQICAEFNLCGDGYNRMDYYRFILRLYDDHKMSCNEISEFINRNSEIKIDITPRSISRALVEACRATGLRHEDIIRNPKESFNNAIKRGRVEWAYKKRKIKYKQLSPGLRLKVLQRDNHRCVSCGATAAEDILEVDHKVPRSEGGGTIEENLQVLCHECNVGKKLLYKEGHKPSEEYEKRPKQLDN